MKTKKDVENCVTSHMKRLGLSEDDALDRNCRRNQVKGQYANSGQPD